MLKPVIPQVMENKWYIYHDDGWLRFHRSWTGALIYAVRFEPSGTGYRAVESWVNRNPEQYRWRNADYDRELVAYMIAAMLLGKEATPPETPREYTVHV